MLVDSHCHLNFPEFAEDLDEVVKHAYDQRIGHMLTVNTRLSESVAIQKIAEKYPNIFCSVGIHPHDSKDHHHHPNLSDQLALHAKHPKVVALGETGLDYYYNHSDRESQIDCFKVHLEASHALDLPVIIHTRNADDDTIACLDEYPNTNAVLHCFSGSKDLAKLGLDRGLYISFSGIITFKNADDLRNTVEYVPLDRVLVETDSPFLAPLPHRGKRNEPAYMIETAKKLAELKDLTIDEICDTTTTDAIKIFGLDHAIRPEKN